MSTDATEAPPEAAPAPKKKRGFFGRFIPSTAPGCASALAFLFLLVAAIVVWTLFWRDPNNVPWRHSIGWGRISLVAALIIVIPLVLRSVLRLWLEGESSLFPDIDNAWKAGVDALEEQGISIDSLPVFLVLGSSSYQHEKSIMQASRVELRVEATPGGPAPLHWYASSDAIYLFCSDASWSSALSVKRQRRFEEFGPPTQRKPKRPGPPAANPMVFQRTANPPPAAAPAAPTPTPTPPPSGAHQGTLQLDQFINPAEPQPAPSAPDGGFAGTIQLDSAITAAQQAEPEPEETFDDTGASHKPITLNSNESTEQLRRLQYVCQLVRQARQPICPVNGVLTLVSFDAIEAGTEDCEAVQQAVRSDLMTAQHVFQLRFPVTALVVNMERERGFRELVRRVGRERASTQRFGRKLDVRTHPSAQTMVALGEHLCGSFEDWSYALFREKNALTRPGNLRLYNLLCKVRCSLKNPLTELLSDGFAHDPELVDEEDALLFSGCYFAATGERADHQAFVKGVFDKLADEEENVEWTYEAIRLDRSWERFATLGLLLSALLIGVLAWQLFA